MHDIIEILAKKHKVWLNYLKSFGCEKQIAKDIVQEMYLKIDTYVKKTKNNLMYNKEEVNYYFVYVTLNRMFVDYTRLKKRNPVQRFEELCTITNNDEWLNDRNTNQSHFKVYPQDIETYNDYIDQELLDKETEQDVYFNKSKALNDWYNNEDFNDYTSLENEIIDKMDKSKLLNYYQRKIFEEVFINKVSITQLSKDTRISYYSLYNTVRNIKQEIRDNYGQSNI